MATNDIHSSVQNRRQFTRISFKSPAQIFTGEQTIVAQVKDISLKGALVEITDSESLWQPVAGEYCEIVIALDDSPIKIYMHARVAHVTNKTMGLLCEHIDLESIEHLRRLVELNLGDPTLLERELKILESTSMDK